MKMEIKINEVEVTKLNMQPGEILVIKIKNDHMDQSDLQLFKDGFKKLLPNNQVVVLGIDTSGDIQLTTIAKSDNVELTSNQDPHYGEYSCPGCPQCKG